MSDRFFLDTNIFIYTFDKSAAPKSRTAAHLVRKALATRKGVISYQVVQEFFNVALRRFPAPMKVAEAEQYLATVFRPLLSIHSSQSLYAEALRMQGKHRLSWYDSLIVAAAVQAECAILFTEDLHHGLRFGTLQIENPFA